MKKSLLALIMLLAGFQNSILSMGGFFDIMKNPVVTAYLLGSFVVPVVFDFRDKAYKSEYDETAKKECKVRKTPGEMFGDTVNYFCELPSSYAQFPSFVNKTVSYDNLVKVWFGVYLTSALSGNAKPSFSQIKNFVTGTRAGQALAVLTAFRLLMDGGNCVYGYYTKKDTKKTETKVESVTKK